MTLSVGLFNTDFLSLNLIGRKCFPGNIANGPLTTCGMFRRVQEFNAVASIETFDIKWVFTKALDTCFYRLTNIVFNMNALCMFH